METAASFFFFLQNNNFIRLYIRSSSFFAFIEKDLKTAQWEMETYYLLLFPNKF